jgi:3-phenylpropionate/trans-cinnamate dioxygenase ferredoxin component
MSEFVLACGATEIPDPGQAVFEIDDHFVVVFHVGGTFYALEDCCTHDGGELGHGALEGFQIVCPRHGARFDIRTGRVLAMPATSDTPSHEVKVENGDVLVKIRE